MNSGAYVTSMLSCLMTAALTTVVAHGSAALSQTDFAIRAKRILPLAEDLPEVIEGGVIIVRDGIIDAIGPARDIDIPTGLPLLEFPHETIAPGFVAASSNLVGDHWGDESISGFYAAVDAFDRYGDYREILASGVTTAHVSPGWNRLVSGRGAVVRLAGPPDERVLIANSDLTVTLGPGVYTPPDLVRELTAPSPDNVIEPAQAQRPSSRIGQYLALKEALAAAALGEGVEFNPHLRALGAAWSSDTPIRLQAHRAVDIAGGVNFFQTHDRDAYIVGGIDAVDAIEDIRQAAVPLVYTVDASFRSPAEDIGYQPDPLIGDLSDMSRFDEIDLAIAGSPSQSLHDLRFLATLAVRGGLDQRRALEAITRTPAEVLGVADRVGALAVGMDADFVVWSGHPIDPTAHASRTFVRGRMVYRAPSSDSLLVRGGTIWRGPNDWLNDGAVLIEDGRIAAVGKRVPAPPGCSIIDVASESFIVPGLIDAHGHLGLGGDRSGVGTEITLARLVGAPEITDLRVAQAGVTTVLLAPYSWQRSGTQVAAVKTGGESRSDRVVRSTAAVAFDVAGVDPAEIAGRIKPRLEAGKKYLETWRKYEKELAEWEEKKAKGELDEIEAKPAPEETTTEPKEDPVTGIWSATISGGPIPEPQTGKVSLRLTGNQVEGRVVEPVEATEIPHQILGVLSGASLTGTIEGEFGLPPDFPQPTWNAELDSTDHMTGQVGVEGVAMVNFEASRIDKTAQEFKAMRARRTRGEDGRPLPPKTDESLEPLRALLEKKIPALVHVGHALEIDAALDLLVDEYELPVVLLDSEGARIHSERLAEAKVGVVLPTSVMRQEDFLPYHQGADLSRSGVLVAFQSGAEDGARSLPLVGLYAVERGMSPEQALAAMTINAARMFHIDDRVGSIEKGKDGDLVVFSGHPFDGASAVRHVIVNGREIPQ